MLFRARRQRAHPRLYTGALPGAAVALNAGGSTYAASSFYLPLQRVVSALAYVRAGSLAVPRGTDRVVWSHTTYDELKKLGLRECTERRMRATSDRWQPQASGLLVVKQVVQRGKGQDASQDAGQGVGALVEGSSDTGDCNSGRDGGDSDDGNGGGDGGSAGLDVGDVLIAVNGEDCTHFVDLEAALDAAVGETITVSPTRSAYEACRQRLLRRVSLSRSFRTLGHISCHNLA